MSKESHYDILKITPEALEDDIKHAYRKLAREYHPDTNPNASQEMFQRITQAYNVLSDPEQRSRYDTAHGFGPEALARKAEASRNPDPPPRAEPKTSASPKLQNSASSDPAGFFRRMFGGNKTVDQHVDASIGAGRRTANPDNVFARLQGERKFRFTISVFEAIQGTTREVVLSERGREEKHTVSIPAGTPVGEPVLLDCSGDGLNRLQRIEAVVQIEHHPNVELRGLDVLVRVPVTIGEALQGVELQVPTYNSSAPVRIPAGFNYQTKIRLKAAGAKDKVGNQGDLYIAPFIVPPSKTSEQLSQASQMIDAHYETDVRQNFPRTLKMPLR